jgi:hypothetical protein
MVITLNFASAKDLMSWHHHKQNVKLFKRTRSFQVTGSDGLYYGYITGVLDGVRAANRDVYFKIPDGANIKTIGSIVDEFITRNKENIDENESAASVVIAALQEKWPHVGGK